MKIDLEAVRTFLGELFRTSGLEVECELEAGPDRVDVILRGRDEELVLGRNGQLLYAVNHLLNQVFYRRVGGRVSFLVDCDGYRAARTLELQLLARKAAEKVRRSGMPFPLQPMPDVERRVVHLALMEEAGIRSESQGAGEQRRVVIVPADGHS